MMGSGWGMGWMMFIWPLIVLGIVLLVVFLVRGTAPRPSTRGGETAPPPAADGRGNRAQQILDERYAGGELTDDEYQERLRHLRGESDH